MNDLNHHHPYLPTYLPTYPHRQKDRMGNKLATPEGGEGGGGPSISHNHKSPTSPKQATTAAAGTAAAGSIHVKGLVTVAAATGAGSPLPGGRKSPAPPTASVSSPPLRSDSGR